MVVVLTLLSCVTKPPKSDYGVWSVDRARRDAPADTLVGIGNAKMGTVSLSRQVAQARARIELSQAMDVTVRNMLRDFTMNSEMDTAAAISFQESMSVALSESRLLGARVWSEHQDADGSWWAVMHLDKDSFIQEISQAQAQARLEVPMMMSFDAEDRMNDAFDEMYRRQRQVGR